MRSHVGFLVHTTHKHIHMHTWHTCMHSHTNTCKVLQMDLQWWPDVKCIPFSFLLGGRKVPKGKHFKSNKNIVSRDIADRSRWGARECRSISYHCMMFAIVLQHQFSWEPQWSVESFSCLLITIIHNCFELSPCNMWYWLLTCMVSWFMRLDFLLTKMKNKAAVVSIS